MSGCSEFPGARFATTPAPPFAAADAIGVSATAAYTAVDGGTVQFSSAGSYDLNGAATETWDFGDSTSSSPAALGTSPSHTYPGPGTYDFILTVTDVATGLTDQATGVVTIAASGPIAVDHVVVQPAQCDGHVGDIFALRAIAYDASGNILSGQTFTWTSDNHTVAADPAGGSSTTATALATGTANLQAHCAGVDSNVVPLVISAPLVITGRWPDLPGTYTVPTGYEIDCSAAPDGVYTPSYGPVTPRDASSYSPGGGVTAPASPPGSPPDILEFKYPAGMQQGIAPAVLASENFTTRGWTELWLGAFLQPSSNFYGHPSGINKMLIANIHGKPCLVLSATGSGTGGLTWELRLQDLGVGTSAINISSGRSALRGRWQRAEIQAIANTPGSLDGILRLWLSTYDASGALVSGPTKVIERTDIGWCATGSSRVWNSSSISPIWGGNEPGVVVPATQYLWADHFITAGKV